MKYLLIYITIVGCSLYSLQAQEISKFDLERRAEHHFQHQRYLKASADYEILYNMYPKDAEYAYYLGRSFLHSNRYLQRSADLLKFAARRNFGEDTYFYLGQAYHLNYDFEDAALAFITFQKQASSKILKKFDVDYWIASTSNARQSVEVAQYLNIESMHAVPATAAEGAFKDISHGKYIYIPDEFRSKTDEAENFHSLMFLPNQIEVGELVFFSSLSKNGKSGVDIYYSKRLTEADYSLPEPLPEAINTDYDDAYPYFDKSSSTLYFSSKGHNTSGGYDIYKSQWNESKQAWSTAEKLAFPINSVHDDFLYTTWGEENEVIFITNRNTTPNELEAYSYHASTPPNFVSPDSKDEVITYALLTPSSVVIDQPVLARIDQELDNQISLAHNSELSREELYARYIEEALDLQVNSDSLSSIARRMRTEAMAETNFQKRKDLVASITSLDREAKRMQHEADSKFKEAAKMRSSEPRASINTVNQESGSNDITLIAHSGTKASAPKEQSDGFKEGYAAAAEMSRSIGATFDIMKSSPYSTTNPIPVASIPAGLVYRIQLGAYTNTIPDNTFGGLSPVSKERTSSSTKYFVGVFTSITEARSALEEVKEYGYPDAFLVSYYDKSKISVQEAREIEFANR